MDNSGIIRNRAKIEGTVASARVYLEIEVREGFSNFLWKFFDGRPQQNGFHSRAQIPPQSPKSVALSKGLKERGFKFCGPTIVYAFCQATGMVNDHLVSCWRYDACAALAHPPAIA
jgi:DNA-3-methyladenine glycosylase I